MNLPKEKLKFYLYWLGPAAFFAIFFLILPIHVGFPLNFFCGYLWMMALYSTELKEKTTDSKYRFSFLRLVFVMNSFSEKLELWNKYPKYKELGVKFFGPACFTLIIFIISPGIAPFFFVLGSAFFEVQRNRYLKIGVDQGPLK